MVAHFRETILPPGYVVALGFLLRFIPTAAVKPCSYRRKVRSVGKRRGVTIVKPKTAALSALSAPNFLFERSLQNIPRSLLSSERSLQNFLRSLRSVEFSREFD